MTGQLVLPPTDVVKKFDPRRARAWAEARTLYTLDDVVGDIDGLDATVTWSGGYPPTHIDWGDGTPVVVATSPASYTYAAAGTYTVTVSDLVGQSGTVTLTAEDA